MVAPAKVFTSIFRPFSVCKSPLPTHFRHFLSTSCSYVNPNSAHRSSQELFWPLSLRYISHQCLLASPSMKRAFEALFRRTRFKMHHSPYGTRWRTTLEIMTEGEKAWLIRECPGLAMFSHTGQASSSTPQHHQIQFQSLSSEAPLASFKLLTKIIRRYG